MKVWIRADGNEHIGTWACDALPRHCRRHWRQPGVQVCFVMADDAAAKLVKSRGKKVRILHTRYDRMEEELPVLTAVMEEEHPDMLLIDSYYVSDAYLERLTEQVWTAYIDDKSFHSYPVNMIINYNIYGDRSLYHPEPAYSLMGATYAPLRPEFQ